MWQEIGIRLSALLYCSIRGKYPPLIRGKNRFFKNTIFLLFQNHRTMVHFSKCSENNPPPLLKDPKFSKGRGGGFTSNRTAYKNIFGFLCTVRFTLLIITHSFYITLFKKIYGYNGTITS